jgi:hypothetical protein
MTLARLRGLWLLAIAVLLAASLRANALEDPYFVTDHHHLHEAGNLAISNYSVLGTPKSGNEFLGSQMELEYRITKWWATQVQFDGQTTWNDSTVFTGYSWTNKFKLFPANHLINAALVVGWEDGNAADKCFAEIEGHGAEEDLALPNGVTRKLHEHEVETKLIISRDHKGWNFAGNIMVAKPLSEEPWEFGYSLGASRPLSATDKDEHCVFCRRSITAGLEFYGGLGDSLSVGLQNTPQYLGPEIAWKLSERLAVKAGPHFGLTPSSQHVLVHFGVVYEIPDFNKRMSELFHGR